jgi:hypothetical protein
VCCDVVGILVLFCPKKDIQGIRQSGCALVLGLLTAEIAPEKTPQPRNSYGDITSIFVRITRPACNRST